MYATVEEVRAHLTRSFLFSRRQARQKLQANAGEPPNHTNPQRRPYSRQRHNRSDRVASSGQTMLSLHLHWGESPPQWQATTAQLCKFLLKVIKAHNRLPHIIDYGDFELSRNP